MMKKVLFVSALLICCWLLYYFLPNHIVENKTKTISVNAKAFSRTIREENIWMKWWPGLKTDKSGIGFNLNENIYTVTDKRFTSLLINIKNNSDSFETELIFTPLNKDSVMLSWNGKVVSPITVFNKLKLYMLAKSIKKDMGTIMEKIQEFYSNEENIYGLAIKKDFVTDSMLISTSVQTNAFPDNLIIYNMIEKLKNHAKANDALQTNPPMLNIYTTDSIHYKTQVALPLNKKLSDQKDIVYRWMLGGGNILISEVTGGYYTINRGFYAMENYVKDHERIAPAIPFQQLITSRVIESDTSKWVTRLCWPVM